MTRSTYPEFLPSALPRWALVRQHLDAAAIDDVPAAVRRAMDDVVGTVRPGTRACVAVGSRGIDRIDQVVGAVVERLREAGADVFIVPAMGSHGGATAEGQLAVLAGYGITPESMGCEIRSSMETVELGEVVPGVPVFIDRHAFEGADLIVPINRVKPHTDFAGPDRERPDEDDRDRPRQAEGRGHLPPTGYDDFATLIPAVARHTMARATRPVRIALIENGDGHLARIEAVPADRIETREPELLADDRARMPRLPLDDLDVLVVDVIGKDVSGTGLRPQRRWGGRYAGPTSDASPRHPADRRAGPDGGHGGQRVGDRVGGRGPSGGRVDTIDQRKTYVNTVTAKTRGSSAPGHRGRRPGGARDRAGRCLDVDAANARIIRVRDTKHLERSSVSEPALPEVLANGGARSSSRPGRSPTTRRVCSWTTCPTTGERAGHAARESRTPGRGPDPAVGVRRPDVARDPRGWPVGRPPGG